MKPIFFERNRVYRVYLGGKLFSDFFGDAPEDSNFPEEWVASAVRARNEGRDDPDEGLSKPIGFDGTFDQMLARFPQEMLGDRSELRVLVKILDSAVRLPMQAHPDPEFSKLHFHSTHGKAESWVILATRPGAKIYLGFRDGITREGFEHAMEVSARDPHAMEALVNAVPVEPGDVFMIPAKTVHAIGAGCLLLEAQEPTDFTVQPEKRCGDSLLSDYEMFLGLDHKTGFDCFDYTPSIHRKKLPTTISERSGTRYECLIGPHDTDCFCVNRICLTGGSFALPNGPAVIVISEGSGILTAQGEQKSVKKGDYFFLPYAAKGTCTLAGDCLTAIECY